MPGIFGVVDASPLGSTAHQEALVALVRRMAVAMRYEASYTCEVVPSATLAACVGHVGFSHEGRRRASSVPHGNLVVVTTGESVWDCSDSEVTHDQPVTAIGSSSREVLRTYQQFGADGLSRLTRRCAGFIVDEPRGRCLLFNDRYGMERIVIHVDGSRTFFASEAKAILAVAPRTRDFDAVGLAEFFAYGCTLGSHSLFREIETLERGSAVSFDLGGSTRQRYFHPASLEELQPVSAGEFLEGLADSLHTSVNEPTDHALHALGLGVSLTGGLDSRMVMASLDARPGTVPCYTFGSMYRTTEDVRLGRQVAALCGQPHHEIELGLDFLGNFRQNLEQAVYISDGSMGFSGAAELYLNRQAKAIAALRVTGNWGGELMRGVRAFKHVMPRGGFFGPQMLGHMEASRDAMPSPSVNPLSFALFYQVPYQGYGRYSIERSQVVMGVPFLSHDVVKWLYRAPTSTRESIECASAVIARRPQLLAIPTDTGRLGSGPAPIKSLRRTYRRAVAKAEYLTSHGAPHWLASLAARMPAPLIETRLLGRDKFQHFRHWLRKPLADLVRGTLVQQNGAPLGTWFDMRTVSDMVQGHIAGRFNYTAEIDKLMTVALVQQTLFTSSMQMI